MNRPRKPGSTADACDRIADILRGRILRGIHAGALRYRERLPSARELSAEFEADHRTVIAAYRQLQLEGLVELRPRGGVYVAADFGGSPVPLPSATWLTDVFTQAIAREIPIVELHDWMRRAVSTLRVRAVVVQGTEDQIVAVCRELWDDYGIEAVGLDVDALTQSNPPPETRFADLFLTTQGYEAQTRALAARVGKPVIVGEIRPDLIGGEWRLLLRKRVYVILRDERSAETLRVFFEGVPGAGNVRALVLDRDDIDDLPHDAHVYVTKSARDALGTRTVRGRMLPSARLFSDRTAREIVEFVIRANLRAMASTMPAAIRR